MLQQLNLQNEIAASASLEMGFNLSYGKRCENFYTVECFDRNGLLKWVEKVINQTTRSA